MNARFLKCLGFLALLLTTNVFAAGIPVPQQGIHTHVLQKQNGQWLIAAFQNTNLMLEMPFPKGPVNSNPQTKPAP